MSERLFSGATPEEVAAALAPLVDFQDVGLHIADLNLLIEDRLLPHLMRYDLPALQGLFNSNLEEGATLGAEIALEWNQGVTHWRISPGGSTLEELCCRALCRLFGLPAEADATLSYSGAFGNQQALYMALHHHAAREGFDYARKGLGGFRDPSRLAVLASEDAHSSLIHGVRFLGLGDGALIRVGVDENRRMDPGKLRQIVEDLAGSRDIFCIVATAGSFSTGAVDPVDSIADVCDELGSWLHLDGAYGLPYRLVPETASLFDGLERSATITWDPHRQMGIPIPCSVLFARHRDLFEPMDLRKEEGLREERPCPNPGRKSIPDSRPLSALPLVASIRHQGLNGIASRLRRPLEAIRELYEELQALADTEVLHVPDTGVLCFRLTPPQMDVGELDRLQEHICRTMLKKGKRILSVTRVGEKMALRAVAIIPEVTKRSLINTVFEAQQIAGAFR